MAAAVTLAQAGKQVLVIEGRETIGGGTRTEELTEPGVPHDVCSAVHPLAAGSPFLSELPLAEHGLSWAYPPIQFAHPLEGGDAVAVLRSVEETAAGLGDDGETWREVFGSAASDWDRMSRLATAPPLRAITSPFAGLRLARRGLRSGKHLAKLFEGERARAAVAGLAAHAIAPLDTASSGGVALVLGAAAHAVGWPVAAGGSARLTEAMASYLLSLGGEIETGRWVRRLGDLPDTKVVLFDTSPQTAAAIAGERMSSGVRRRLAKHKNGPGVFKLDIVTDGPIPWSNPACAAAGTIHLGGTFDEIAASEEEVARGGHPQRPFVLASQPLVADPERAPQGLGVLWAYCHVPNGSSEDMTERIIAQVERFAPGFESLIRSISMRGPSDLETDNPNYVGGDIGGGKLSLLGVVAGLKLIRPYRIGDGTFLCSAAAPPGPGTHGMCGHHAARAALAELR